MISEADRVCKRIDNALNAYDCITKYKGLSESEAVERVQLLLENRCLVVITRGWDNSFEVAGVLDV